MSKQKFLIQGAGGHAKVVVDVIDKMSDADIQGVFDDYAEASKKVLDYPILGDAEKLVEAAKASDCEFIVAIGDNKVRRKLFEYFKGQGLNAGIAEHPTVTLASETSVGEGSMLIASATINPGCRIGVNVIINTDAVIDHDSVIEDHAHIAPNATLCGNVFIGENTWIGASATVIEGVKVGKNCLVAAGAVVVEDVPDNSIVGGVPAKPLKSKEKI